MEVDLLNIGFAFLQVSHRQREETNRATKLDFLAKEGEIRLMRRETEDHLQSVNTLQNEKDKQDQRPVHTYNVAWMSRSLVATFRCE